MIPKQCILTDRKFGMKLVLPIAVGGMAVLVCRILYTQYGGQGQNTNEHASNLQRKQQPVVTSLVVFSIASTLTLMLIILSDTRSAEVPHTEETSTIEDMLKLADMSGNAPF